MEDLAPALAAAVIWAYASIMYRDFMVDLGVVRLNVLRMIYASLALLVPSLVLGIESAAAYGAVSGVLSLALGDSLYLRGIKAAGVSTALPAAYSYIVMEQFVAIPLGEPLKPAFLAAAGLVLIGVYLLAGRGGGGRGGSKSIGVSYSLAAAVAWSIGYAAIRVAGMHGLNPVSTAFTRVAAALPVLAIAGGGGVGGAVRATWRTPLPLIAVLDLGVGSALFAYSSVAVGLAPTVIATGTAPLAAQLFSRAMGRERPTRREYAAAVLVLLAVAISFQ